MDPIPRVCIVGAGKLSTRRIYPYIGAAGAQLVGICDLDAEKAKHNAVLWGGAVFSNLQHMLDELKPDGLIVCVGPEAHAELATAALERKLPVYTEKPPAASAAAALAVARVAKTQNTLCMTAFKKRYSAGYARAKEFLTAFPPADWYSLSIDYCSAHYANANPRSDFLLDFGIHVIDVTQYLFGDAEQVFAFAKGLDAYAVTLRFTSGAVGVLNLNDGRSFGIPTEEVELTVRGGNFMSLSNSSRWRIALDGKTSEWREPPTFTSAGDGGQDSGHLTELVEFVAAIREQRTETRSSIYESYKSMALYEAIRDSAQSGKIAPVKYESL